MSPRKHTQGFSLVELMVAMVLGLLLTAAAVSLFSTNQRTFQLQQTMGQLQEQGQLAMRFINQDVRRTGLTKDSVTALVLPGVVTTGASPLPSSDGGNNGNDRLTLSYHGGVDCEGDSLTPVQDTMVINSYWVDDDNQLNCEGSLDTGTNGVVLLRGVRSFQVLYGVDSDFDGVAFASQYVTADELSDDPVLAIKIGVLMEADLPSMSSAEQEQRFYILDREVTVDEGRTMRRQFQSTIAVRNYAWDEV